MIHKKHMSNRRAFLESFLVGGLGISGTSCMSRQLLTHVQTQIATQQSGNKKFSISNASSLKLRTLGKRFVYGAFPQATYSQFASDMPFQSRFIQECGLLVNAAPWDVVHPTENTFDFTQTDYFSNFALKNKMLLQGGALVWQYSNPQWLIDKFQDPATTPGKIESILSNYISQFVGRYKGRFHMWSVVNEAINPEDGRSDGLRDTKISGIGGNRKSPTWLHFLGADYIDLAFRIAHETDPNALLFYNEYGLEYDTSYDRRKRTAVLNLLERLKTKGTPIHALGIQAHLKGHETRFNSTKLRIFLKDVASLGLKILITELDVEDKELPPNINVRDRIIAGVYEDFLSTVLDEPAVITVITWGLSDRYTWLSEFSPREDNNPVRPLPFDERLKPKLAWQAIARVFDRVA